MPWWLAGASLVATSFSIDTPIGIAGLVEKDGIAGVWFAWCFVLGGAGMLGYALMAELWRRSGVLTDAELVELRYGGRGAAILRGVKGIVFGVLANAFTLAWVLKAVVAVGTEVAGRPPWLILAVALGLTLVYSIAAGLPGVVASDLPQVVVAFTAVTGVAVAAYVRVGGPGGLLEGLSARFGVDGAERLTSFAPTPGEPFWTTFLAYVLILWWAHKNAGAAGPVVQRLAACRDEREARRSTLVFSVGTFAVAYWPMILLALCALALHPELSAEAAVPRLFLEGMPAGVVGFLVAALLAAFMSTIDSHLNLAASYLVHDVWKRFVRPSAGERELVLAGRLSTVLVLALAIAFWSRMETVSGAWTLLAALTSGYGLVTLVRWFWWRVNAWSELAALGASGVSTWVWGALRPEWDYGAQLLAIVVSSTAVWLVVTFATRPTDPRVLERFTRTVRPWGAWRDLTGRSPAAELRGRLRLWAFGSAAVLALNFGLGAAVLGRWHAVAVAATVGAAAILVLRFGRRAAAGP